MTRRGYTIGHIAQALGAKPHGAGKRGSRMTRRGYTIEHIAQALGAKPPGAGGEDRA
ncbi:MAG: hypothetical protein GDA40_11680 [Rhodobacteraceae bacterium]|nr:hypothetical protein [Paracoccaceae bacterium]